MSIIYLNKDNFQKEVLEATKPVLIDFYADWCGPCKMLTPNVEKVAEEYKEEFIVTKVNVDDNPELASTFKVMSIPTLVVMKDGKVSNKSVGYCSKDAIVELIKK